MNLARSWPTQMPAETWLRDKGLYLQATTRPGAKLPHVWLVDDAGRKTSTLDLTGKGMFSLLTGLAGRAWTAAASRLAGGGSACLS
jgi:2,4-dichlorophenol 6-monooxygenase